MLNDGVQCIFLAAVEWWNESLNQQSTEHSDKYVFAFRIHGAPKMVDRRHKKLCEREQNLAVIK